MNITAELEHAPLGKKSEYISTYQPDLLFVIPRSKHRNIIGISDPLPFKGDDLWSAYELSWLNSKGKPVVAYGEFIFSCTSPFLVESKSFKLYLNSFNNTRFESFHQVQSILSNDLSKAVGEKVEVRLVPLREACSLKLEHFEGTLLDDLDISCHTFDIEPKFLSVEDELVSETLTSDLLKSNCLVTSQPDWASIQISYIGLKINHAGLLQYLISFRNHNEFHEQCVEHIYADIMSYCRPQKLFVYARYTRRGGLEINPYRASFPIHLKNNRLFRQ